MTIGTSLGAFYEDDFQYQARHFLQQNRQEDGIVIPKNDKTESDANTIDPSVKTEDFITQVSDHTGFTPSANIEDRRDKVYSIGQQWDDGVVGTSLYNQIIGRRLPEEVPQTKLGHEAGYEDIKIERNVGSESPVEKLYNSTMDDIKGTIKIGGQMYDELTK